MKTISRYLLTLVALFAMTAGAWAQEEYESFDLSSANTNVNGTHFTITGTSGMNNYGLFLSGESVTVTSLNGENITRVEFIIGLGKIKAENITGTPGTNSCTNGNENGSITDINATSVTLSTENTGTTSVSIKQITVYYAPTEPDVEVTTNAASEGATFTEATFAMPDDDVTFDYELVREMEVNMTTTVGLGYDGYRIRLKKNDQGQGYVPADLSIAEVMALFTVHDGLEEQDLVFYGDGKVCDISIYAIDENDLPTGDPIVFANLEPGRYVARATADEGSAYTGQTAFSNVFELYEGYEVTVPAGEYITYFRDESLKVEDGVEGIELYTITSVGDTEAELSEKLDIAPYFTPLLVYNSSSETKTFMLIPTNERGPEVEVANEFYGSVIAENIPGSDASYDYYVFNGKQFVWVKNAISVDAFKAWLTIPKGNAKARTINLVRRSTTGIGATLMNNEEMNNELYDLNGRKVTTPTRKGVYIKNGKKVVIK